MKKIRVDKWKEMLSNGEEVESNLLKAMAVLISSKDPKTLPRGLDQFRIFGRLGKAFDNAEKTGFLELEDGDYDFLRKIIEQDIPAQWGMVPEILNAFNNFMGAKDDGND